MHVREHPSPIVTDDAVQAMAVEHDVILAGDLGDEIAGHEARAGNRALVGPLDRRRRDIDPGDVEAALDEPASDVPGSAAELEQPLARGGAERVERARELDLAFAIDVGGVLAGRALVAQSPVPRVVAGVVGGHFVGIGSAPTGGAPSAHVRIGRSGFQ